MDFSALLSLFQPSTMQSWLPGATGVFSGLNTIMNLIQQFQRAQQLAQWRKYYSSPGAITANAQQFFNSMLPAATQVLGRTTGDVASLGLSGSRTALADAVARAYAPYQTQALQMAMNMGGQAAPFLTSPAGESNPFSDMLKALTALKGLNQPKPNITAQVEPIDMSQFWQQGQFGNTPSNLDFSFSGPTS